MNVAVKICGITRMEDALLAEKLGASAIGFIFHPKSKRYITPVEARKISDGLGPFIGRVGVFVNENPGIILSTVKQAHLTAIQLHGLELPDMAALFREVPVIKAFRVRDGFEPSGLRGYDVAALLLDAYDPKQYGGTGKTIDWDMVGQCGSYGRIILAGGLAPENVAEAAATAKPWGVDVSSGVETEPGIKDHEKMRAFFEALKY